jgi:hypothetical protein
MSEYDWSKETNRNNARLKAAREQREGARELKRQAETPQVLSDREELMKGLKDMHTVSVEAREEKPMKGVKIPRPLPRSMSDQIDALPEGHEIRRARAEGRIRYSAATGKWLVDGVAPAPAKEHAPGHLPPGFFSGTARRERERATQ